jgi:hypothetical protein
LNIYATIYSLPCFKRKVFMHIELAPKYRNGLNNIIAHMRLNAHIINSFSASGETIILSASKEDLEKILEATEEDFKSTEEGLQDDHPPVILEGLKAILKDQLADRA